MKTVRASFLPKSEVKNTGAPKAKQSLIVGIFAALLSGVCFAKRPGIPRKGEPN